MRMRMLFGNRVRRAAVLGCGPAGLFAVHALVQNGWEVEVFSRKRRSEMYGAQYLHKPIPGLSIGEGTPIRYNLFGTPEEYRQKVYGNRPVIVSPEELNEQHMAWDIREAYVKAWNEYASLIEPVADINPQWLMQLLSDRAYDQMLSSVPLPALCREPGTHKFDSQTIWAIGDAPERGTFCPVPCKPNTVVLDGTPDVGWYRVSNVFGYTTAEWSENRKPPFENVSQVVKPIGHDCDCWPGLVNIGRYGAWAKGYLSHQAYERAAML
jgi:hypothetical protein